MSNSNTEQAYQEIINRLHSLRRQWRLLLLSHSLLRWLGAVAIALALVLIIDQILPLPRLFRMGLVLLWLGIGAYAAFSSPDSSCVSETHKRSCGGLC